MKPKNDRKRRWMILPIVFAMWRKTVVIVTGKKGCFIKKRRYKMEVPAVAGITATTPLAPAIILHRFIAALLEGKKRRVNARTVRQ